MSHKQNDIFYEARGEWLSDQGRSEGDVVESEKGEYVLVDEDFTDATTGGEVRLVKKYLPDDLQNHG